MSAGRRREKTHDESGKTRILPATSLVFVFRVCSMPPKLRRIRAAHAAWEAATSLDVEACADGSVRHFRRAGQARAWIDWLAEGGPQLIRIESFAPPHGGRLLRLITRICDEFGLTMRAVASPYNPTSEALPPPRKRQSLLSWYSKHGFALMGDDAVFYDGLMRRRRRVAPTQPSVGRR